MFVDDVVAGQVRVGQEDFHHLSHVLRLRPGEAVSASDGAGWVRPCCWTGSPLLEAAGEAAHEGRLHPVVTVAFSLTKGAHPEWAVQKLTEAGVDRVVVMTTARSVPRWELAAPGRRLARLREVARQAAMQSRRAWLPVVEGPVTFSEVTGPAARAGPFAMALAVRGGAPITLAAPTVLVGPEGGWEEAELEAVSRHVTLGPHVLRAETAALTAGALLVALRAGVVAEAGQQREENWPEQSESSRPVGGCTTV